MHTRAKHRETPWLAAALRELPAFAKLFAMDWDHVALVTITLARTTQEERTLINSLKLLQTRNLPLFAADGGSSTRFLRSLRKLEFFITAPKTPGLVHQVKAGLRAALENQQTTAILYTEPDKYPFFGAPLATFLNKARLPGKLGLAIAARNTKSFRTFPKGQQWTESFMNQAARLALGGPSHDYCYGPLLLSPRAAEIALDSPPDLGWGWRFWTMARAHKEHLDLQVVKLNVPCPEEQRREDSRADRLYRLKQLRQNLEALEKRTGTI